MPDQTFEVDFVEKETLQVDFVEKETFLVDLITIDFLPGQADKADFIYNEIPILVSGQQYQTVNNFVSGSLRIFVNGIKEKYFTIQGSNKFTLDLLWTIDSTDDIEVNYIKQS